MIKRTLSVATLATLTAASLHAVDAGTPHVDRIDGTVQFFNEASQEFSFTANAAPHQQNAVLVADGHVYVVYYDQDGSLIVARRSATDPTDSWLQSEFSPTHDSTDPDSHRTANIAVSPGDKRLHILWGHHADKLRYVVTKDPNATLTSDAQFGASLFEPERQFLALGENLTRVCYPRMFVGPNDKLQVVWRDDGGSGSANSYIATYNGDKTWTPRLQIIDGFTGVYSDPDSTNNGTSINANRNAYFNDIGYRNGKTHVSWTWRENSQNENGLVTNHDLHYAYSADGGDNWYNHFDIQVAGPGSWTMNLNTTDVKFTDLPYAKKVDNQCGQTIDSEGGVHMLWRHLNDANQKKMFHYYKADGSSAIVQNELSVSSSARPKIYADPTEDAENTLYIVTIAANKVRVYGANKGENNWGTWSQLYSSNDEYVTATAQIAADGRTLYILAQRRPADVATGTSSQLDMITLPVSPYELDDEPPPVEEKTVTLPVIEDTYVRGGTNAATNYDGRTDLQVRNNDNASNINIAYAKFDLGSLPSGGVTSAELTFSAAIGDPAATQSDITISLFGIPTDSWDAPTLTWNSAPNHAEAAAEIIGEGTEFLGSVIVTVASQVFTLDATDFINANIADGFASFAAVGVTKNGKVVQIRSAESGSGATLEATYGEVVEEPSVDFVAVEDAYIRGGSNSANNYGHEGAFSVRNNSSVSNDMMGYVKFDLTSILRADIDRAVLALSGRNASKDAPIAVSLWGLENDDWSEDTLTWDNAPNHAANDAVVEGEGASLLGTLTFAQPSVVQELDVTEFVRSAAIDGKVSFAIATDMISGDVVRIDSSETTNGVAPVLKLVHGEVPERLERPFIWTRDSERADILAKIANNAWAANVFQGMKDRIAGALAAYEADKDAFLRELPISWDDADPIASTVESEVRGPFRNKLRVALDAAILYHLTQDERYAHLGADIMQNAIEGFSGLAPSTSTGNGGWLLQDDHLKECREISIQLPIVYDYLYDWLFDGHRVYDVKAGKKVRFAWENAQFVFRTFANLTLEHGTRDNNWSVLMTPSLIHNGLAIDDPELREEIVYLHTNDGTPRQGPVGLFAGAHQDGNIWPESLQYSNAVANWSVYAMTLLDRYDPGLGLYEKYPQLPNALPRIRELTFPNGEFIRFGDGPRVLGAPYHDYEMTYQQAVRNGNAELAETLGSLIVRGIESGEHNRAQLKEYETLSPHHAPLQLLWYAADVTQDAAAVVLPRADALPFATIAMQRNEAADGDPQKGLMYHVGGGHFVHAHAGGMNMELYGLGEVLGVDPGHVDYARPEHVQYYRNWAAHNTIIVNGSSRGEGGWSMLGTHNVKIEAMEPMAKQAALSPDISFTHTSFIDDAGDGAEATQLRTMAMIRTGEESGFYVDLFRSNSSLANEYHDYVYHNIGDRVDLLDANASPIALRSDPDRYQSDIGDDYQQPGWRYFENPMTSGDFSGDVAARWVIEKLPAGKGYMEMRIPGQANREYTIVDAPKTTETVAGYNAKTTPTLVIRKQGEAWNQPFSAVFEPRLEGKAPVVQSVEDIADNGVVAGMRVKTMVNGMAATYHIFALPEHGSYSDLLNNIHFEGRFGIIIEKADGSITFYMGDASSMTLRRNVVRSVSGEPTAANIVLRPGQEPAVRSKAPLEIERIDTTVAAAGQLVYAADYTSDSNRGNSRRVSVEDDVVSVLGAGTWIAFPNFDFGTGVSAFHVIAANPNTWTSPIELRKLAPDGPLIGKVDITPTVDTPAAFQVFTTEELDRVNGINDLYLVFPRGGIEIGHFFFEKGVGGIGEIELSAIADGITRGGGNASNVNATGNRLEVKDTANEDFDRVSYIKFDLDQIPASRVLSADLYLRGSMREQSGSINIGVYGVTNDDWNETNLSWSRVSDMTLTDAAIIDPNAIFEGFMNFKYLEWTVEDLDVSSSVNANLLDGRLSLALIDENDTNAQTFIDSREQSSGMPPMLHVLYEYIPSEIGTRINAASYDDESHPEDLSRIIPRNGYLGFVRDGTWVKFSRFNFDTGASAVTLTANKSWGPAGVVEFRAGSPEGDLLARIEIDPALGASGELHSYTVDLLYTPKGQQDLYLVFKNRSQDFYQIESFKFD